MFSKLKVKKLRSISAAFGIAAAIFMGGSTISNAQTTRSKLHDFTGNNRTDFTTLGFTTNGPIRWKVTGNPASAVPGQAFKREFDYGLTNSDAIVVGDYIGDLKADVTVFRETPTSAPGFFYVAQFPIGTGPITLDRAVQFGNGIDIVATPGDYDGDGKTDYCVVRQNSNGSLVWYIMSSTTNVLKTINFGTTVGAVDATVFPGADFNNDGRDELIFLTVNSAGAVTYYVGDANTGAGVITRTFGSFSTDYSIAPNDYTGDGRADLVAVRQSQGAQSIWYILNPQTNVVTATPFGIADADFDVNDLPVRGDFDGDNRHDICVWRYTNQTFYYISSVSNTIQAQKAGDATDTPLGSLGIY